MEIWGVGGKDSGLCVTFHCFSFVDSWLGESQNFGAGHVECCSLTVSLCALQSGRGPRRGSRGAPVAGLGVTPLPISACSFNTCQAVLQSPGASTSLSGSEVSPGMETGPHPCHPWGLAPRASLDHGPEHLLLRQLVLPFSPQMHEGGSEWSTVIPKGGRGLLTDF